MKCVHEWRLFGTRLEEEVFPIRPGHGPIICTKCGVQQHAEYEEIERRSVPHYSGSWEIFKDTIVKVKYYTIFNRTCGGFNERTNKVYDGSRYAWDLTKEQWIKIYPITFHDWIEYWRNAL